MKTEFIRLPALLLGGVSYYGDPFSEKEGWDSENEIGKTWRRFMALRSELYPCSCGQAVLYEIHIYGAETPEKGYFEVFVGEAIFSAQLPPALSVKCIPASEYVKVTLTGQEITEDWSRTVQRELLPAEGYASRPEYAIQAYDDRFQGMDDLEHSTLVLYLPVVKQDERGGL